MKFKLKWNLNWKWREKIPEISDAFVLIIITMSHSFFWYYYYDWYGDIIIPFREKKILDLEMRNAELKQQLWIAESEKEKKIETEKNSNLRWFIILFYHLI